MTEWNAADYARLSGLQKAMAGEVLALLALAGSEQVLDVGCGEGKVSALIAARVSRGGVIGVDPSHVMIAFATAHFGPAVCPNLRFEVADARALPFRDRFDLVVSLNALHWVPDQDAALRSIRIALKSGGRVQLRLVTTGERKSLESVVEDTRWSSHWMAHFHEFDDPYLRLTPDEYAAAAERNGLHVLRVHTAAKTWDFKSPAAFFNFSCVGLVAWTKRLPAAERPVFVHEVLDRYRAISVGRAGEENMFRFYQTDLTLSRDQAFRKPRVMPLAPAILSAEQTRPLWGHRNAVATIADLVSMNEEKEKRILHRGEFLRLLRRRHWEYVERVNSRAVVVLVAITADDKLLLVEQFRWPVDRAVIELPAGLVGDVEADESLTEAARRELLEETGYAAKEIEALAAGPVTAGLSNEVTYFYAARGLVRAGAGGGDESEDIRVHEVPLADIATWLGARPADVAVDPKIYAGLWLWQARANPRS